MCYGFDIRQTDGEPLPDVRPELLPGQAPAGMWAAVVEMVTPEGYTVEWGECGGANGDARPATRTVRVRADVDDAQVVKTLVHELPHVLLHTGSAFDYARDPALAAQLYLDGTKV